MSLHYLHNNSVPILCVHDILLFPLSFSTSLLFLPGCGHCKRLAPAYEEVGKAYDNSDDVVIAKVDCDAERSLAQRFGVSGYPTLKFFPKGSTEPEA